MKTLQWKWMVLGGGLLLAACGVKAPPRPVVPESGPTAPADPGRVAPGQEPSGQTSPGQAGPGAGAHR